ncbi:putative short chain dehydrogenase-3 [Coleophoma cylindrospora]|uniref:Putative short chain dehydrogenase-3 n=1 Tax=Coleophoma cylindrospora TaxID=1849047 RepID=A0A3D8RCH2_9HELO|nr:putative short chain dehydrogenase-3 [Coleophoma cylindrospora]
MASFPYKTVLMIGATSGIGLALAEKMIENGCFVIASGRRQENLDALVTKYGAEKVAGVKFDITDLNGIPGFVESVTKAHPTLDCVILNSGIQRPLDFTQPASINLPMISEEFNTNYLAHVHLTTAFLPFLREASRPVSLIYTTSALALVPILRCGNYCASKAAMHHLILVLREQLRGSNVKVIEIMPPAVQTELHDEDKQPDIKNGRAMGMPLDEFTEEAWEGLCAGQDDIPVGMAKRMYDAFETKRQEVMGNLVKMVH